MAEQWVWQPLDDLCGERYENSQDGACCELPERLQHILESRVPAEFLAEQKKEEERMRHFIAGEVWKDLHPLEVM